MQILDIGKESAPTDSLEKPAPYYVRYSSVETKAGCWNYLNVEIIERETEKVIGSYLRNYSSLGRTFLPFKLRGKWYALYSKDYTSTRVMSLPDCKDLGGEDQDCRGFCPTDYYVPLLHHLKFKHDADCPRYKKEYTKSCSCPNYFNDEDKWEWSFPDCVHGFVAGCVWGDDSSWKIQYLDLSRADEGIIKREEKFGYIELPENLTLDKAIHVESEDEHGTVEYLRIDISKDFNLKELTDVRPGPATDSEPEPRSVCSPRRGWLRKINYFVISLWETFWPF